MKKRSTALKHRNVSPAIQRIIVVHEDVALKRIEISMRPNHRQSLTVMAWADRSIWVHACESIKNAGWLFQFTDSGRLAGTVDEDEIVKAMEASLSAMFGMSAETVGRLSPIRHPLLAKGSVPLPPS